MNERIKKLTDYTMSGQMYPQRIPVKYDREDALLSPVAMSAKRACEYIIAQEPIIYEESSFTGHLEFDGSVEGDVFRRRGHKSFKELRDIFYNKPLRNLVTFEWQHSTGDFEQIIKYGIRNVKERISRSKLDHAGDKEALEFLCALDLFCDTVIKWAHKCSTRAYEKAQTAQNEAYRANLIKLSEALKKVPEHPSESFYEALVCLNICFTFAPDSGRQEYLEGVVNRVMFG